MENNDKILCIYHKDCLDGWGAAMAVICRFEEGNVELLAAQYGDAAPDVQGRKVIIVDFSYPRAVLEVMAADADVVLVFDHHKTAAENLAGLTPLLAVSSMLGLDEFPLHSLLVQFDMDRSGAGMAWDFFIGLRRRLIDHIEDRDLWRFQLAMTREIVAAVSSFPMDVVTWRDLIHTCDTENLGMVAREGAAILRYQMQKIEETIALTRSTLRIAGQVVPVANVPKVWSSEAANMLAVEAPFGVVYWLEHDAVVFSLRSLKNGPDVSEIAKRYGGGGHRNAAGFKIFSLRVSNSIQGRLDEEYERQRE